MLLCVGDTDLPVAPSPSTRVGVVLAEGAADGPARGSVDVVWRAHGEGTWDELAQAVKGLAAK